MKALIVDDELRARRSLTNLLEGYCTDVEVVAAVGSVGVALETLREQRVDVVFLDIHMPERSGFALAELPELRGLHVVFVTAHAEHALRAFRVDAVDYLLKPVSVDQLRLTVERIRSRLSPQTHQAQGQFVFYANGSQQVVPLADLLYLEADGSYTRVVAVGASYLIAKPIGALSESLEAAKFCRSHRSYVVNLRHVVEIGPSSSPTLTLSSQEILPLSRSRRASVLAMMKADC